jgi:predicted O-linked N-acetylglucosamine transferase (SPINDLY family)
MPNRLYAEARARWRRGRAAEAETLVRAAIGENPFDIEAQRLFAEICAATGRVAAALEVRTGLSRLAPGDHDNLLRLAELRLACGRAAEALSDFERLLPAAAARLGRIQALLALGHANEALIDCDVLLAARAEIPGLRSERAFALLALGRPNEALAAAQEAVASDPRSLPAQLALGASALAAGVPELALQGYDAALALQPRLARAHAGRGLAQVAAGRYQEAIETLAQAVRMDPAGATAVFLQSAYHMLQIGRAEAALLAFSRLLQLQPRLIAARQGRTVVLTTLGRYEEALPELRTLRQEAPGSDYLAGVYFHAQLQECDWSDYERAREELAEGVRRGQRVDTPLSFIVHNESPHEQRLCAQIYAAQRCPVPARPIARPPRPEAARVRLAYLSADLRNHAVGQLIAGVIEGHDRARFETFAFSTSADDGSALRQRLAQGFGHFIDAAAWTDEMIAARMAELHIDIAVDLTVHSTGGRTGALAFRAAPVQISFLGYPGTSGTDFIDYIVADRHVIPDSERAEYSEQIIYLPDTYLPSDGAPAAGVPVARAAAGLPESGVVFCCFNAHHKISPLLFDVWARLLEQVPDSVLWLRSPSAAARARLGARLAARQIDPARLLYAQRTPTRAEHYARFSLADLFLDTYPYNAHTTASEALGVGVPVVTLQGHSFASRVAKSLLEACGLGRLATDSLEDYERLALELARSPAALRDLKAHLQRVRSTSPLFDTRRYCGHLEAAYLEAWRRHCGNEPRAVLRVMPASGGVASNG